MNYTPWHKADIYLGKPNFKIIAPLSSDLRSHFTYLKPFFSQVEFYVCPVFCDRLRLSLFLYEDKIKAKVWPRIDLAEIMGPMDSASRLVIGRYVAHLKKKITRKSTQRCASLTWLSWINCVTCVTCVPCVTCITWFTEYLKNGLLTDSPTDNLKSKDASASKKQGTKLLAVMAL